MLINSPRHTIEDLAAWRRLEDQARVHAQLSSYRKHVERARGAVLAFAGAGKCYAGVSWGKDSVALARLVVTLAPRVPIVWVHRVPYDNPDCELVRDAFLRLHPSCVYHEEVVQCEPDPERPTYWRAAGVRRVDDSTRPKQIGFARVNARFGERYLSGLRGDESGPRKSRMKIHGESTARTCAPIGWWSSWDVFAFLTTTGMPVHPAYACTMGGLLDPARVRVGSLGGHHGQEFGRREWEQRYYREELRQLGALG